MAFDSPGIIHRADGAQIPLSGATSASTKQWFGSTRWLASARDDWLGIARRTAFRGSNRERIYEVRPILTGLAAVTAFLSCAPVTAARRPAITLLRAAIAAQGGEEALRHISTIQWRAHGYRNMLEQSERPEGPYIPEFRDVTETHDQARGRFRSLARFAVYPEFKGSSGILADRSVAVRIIPGGKAPGNASSLAGAREALALSPERLLLTAITATDVRLGSRTILQAVPQDVIDFTLDGARARLFLNAYTHLPTALDYDGPLARQDYWRFLGDTEMRTYFSFWWKAEGIRMPMQWDVYRNGLHDSTFVIDAMTINSPIAEEEMQIPQVLRDAFAKTGSAEPFKQLATPVGIAPGITFIPGPWDVTLVKQGDGVVVIEAPISSAYSELVLQEAAKRYPGLRVKAVISTSDSWPHIAGLRPYVARGIPIYCLDLDRPALSRIATMSYARHPDALQRAPRSARFIVVTGKLSLGQGENRIELFPLRGETSERQMMAYLPRSRILYGSDPFQRDGNGSYETMQAVSELVDAVAREDLHPRTFIMMHVAQTPWSSLLKAAETQKDPFPQGLDASQ